MDLDTPFGEATTCEGDRLLISRNEVKKLDAMVDDIGSLAIGVKADFGVTGIDVDEAIDSLAAVKDATRSLEITVRELVESAKDE